MYPTHLIAYTNLIVVLLNGRVQYCWVCILCSSLYGKIRHKINAKYESNETIPTGRNFQYLGKPNMVKYIWDLNLNVLVLKPGSSLFRFHFFVAHRRTRCVHLRCKIAKIRSFSITIELHKTWFLPNSNKEVVGVNFIWFKFITL